MHRGGSSPWHLRVAEGSNAGAELELLPGTYSVGCGVENDIVLSDSGVVGQHVSLDIRANDASLVAHADGAALQGQALSPGRSLRLVTGAEIRIGTTVLRVSGPAQTGMVRPGRLVCGAMAALGLAAGLLTYGLTPSTPHARQNAAVRPQDIADLGSAQREMSAHLRAAGFGSSLQVGTAEGALVVTGALLPADQPAWHDAQAWFDKRFGGRFSLVSRTGAATAETLPQLDIAAVSLSPIPSVIALDGERYTVGAVLAGGWTITTIAADGVVLRRQGRDVRITL